MVVQPCRLLDEARVHEDIAGERGEPEVPKAELRSLVHDPTEEVERHRDPRRALLLGVGAEAAFEVAGPGWLDVDRRAGVGDAREAQRGASPKRDHGEGELEAPIELLGAHGCRLCASFIDLIHTRPYHR